VTDDDEGHYFIIIIIIFNSANHQSTVFSKFISKLTAPLGYNTVSTF